VTRSTQKQPGPKTGARICIITPGQIGSNPRAFKEAQALHDAGFRVTVIATRTLALVEPLDQSIIGSVPWKLERLDLRSRLRWRTLRAVQLLARRASRTPGLLSLADIGFSAFTMPLRRAAQAHCAELYIAHYPAALPAAARAARRHGGLYAYDAEDFHPGDWPDEPAYETERRLLREVEGRYLPGCSYITAASPLIADAYADVYGIGRPLAVLNTFPLGQAPAGSTAKGTAEPGPSVYWFSQTIGPHRGIECAVRAAGLARCRPHLYLRGSLASGYGEHLERLAHEAGAAGRVHTLPPAEPQSMERLAAAYDVGLVSETGHTGSRRMCLTNKLFSFILAGIPPVMSDTPAHRGFASEAGLTPLLYPIGDAAALATLLDGLLGAPGPLAAARAQAWRLGQSRYNWERERVELLRVVERAISGHKPITGEFFNRRHPDPSVTREPYNARCQRRA
jgi:glycosyltransferase involved in cell wall biosynthesis